MIKVGIAGATGYAGQQLFWILAQHPEVQIQFIASHSFAEQQINHVYKNYQKYAEQTLIAIDSISTHLPHIDLLFLALPHGLSEALALLAVRHKVKVIDLGADFRLDDSQLYEKWYHVKHQYPELNQQAVYGLPELYREKIQKSQIIASPGCYPTSAILAIAPLLVNQLIETSKMIVDSKSGVSGAGRNTRTDLLYSEVNESFKAYNILKHRHTPEIKQELDKLGKCNTNLIFTPHLLPINRGILSTIYLSVKPELKDQLTEAVLYDYFRQYYQDAYFIRITEDLPEIKNVKHSNICEIGLRYDAEFGNLVLVSAIDNLIKGAGGQAVQSMNILFGLEENTGLTFLSMYL